MTDDLVKRLRKGVMCGDDPVIEEAADRIDELGAANDKLSCDALQLYDRIEKLEAALREIAEGTRDVDKSYMSLFFELQSEARKALEWKDV
jgi:uncharacterized coiled-coil DUF342 family protein